MAEHYLDTLFGLRGKRALVIGGAGHLCGAMAAGLSKAGVAVAILDRNNDAIERVVGALRQAGGSVIGLPVDVRLKDDHTRALQAVVKELGGLDIVINGAGINAPTPFFDITLEEWHAILDSHITGTLLACQVYGRYLVEQRHGSIINISSASAGPPLSKAFTYSVAKAGIKNLTMNLAREWATSGVRVNALRPGFFPTEWSMQHFITKEREAAILGHTPLRRYGHPDELVGAVLWLASDAASFVTGAEITVDGGFSCMTI